MTDAKIRDAYALRAAEYAAALGSVDVLHKADAGHIEQWSEAVVGPVVDAGCGPGHWTDFLRTRGVKATGIDFVPEFVDHARRQFPESSFELSSLRNLTLPNDSLGGLLAWYSLIHLYPEDVPGVLAEFARVLQPQGHLLLGFFDGRAREPFDHAITTAYYWSIEEMTALLNDAGFTVIDVETRHDEGKRPHAAISAVIT